MKMVGPLRHIEIIVQQLNRFNPENESVGRFLDESAKVLQASKVTDEIPVMDILCGCLEYKTVLDVVVNAFYIRDGKHCLFSDRNMYIVICYLATFRLEELGLQQFNKIIKSMDVAKICKIIKEFPNLAEKFQAQKIKFKTDNTPVKLNTAAVLREGVLYQRKVEQELKRIEHLLQGARDPSKFLEWQKQMRGKDLDRQLTEAECRKLQGKLSYEEAILARQYCIQENQKKAGQKREEKAEMRHQCAERCRQERKEKKKKVQQVAEGRKNMKQAQMKLQKCKQQIVQEVSKKSQDTLLQALKDEEEKLKKKNELIQQIRAIEYLPFLKNRFIDLTKTANHGVLGEMSFVELQERLALLKEAQQKAEEEKRDLIIHEKHAKEQLLLDKLEQICMFREQFGRAAALKQEEKKTKIPLREAILKEEQVLDLQKKITEKSTERKVQTEYLKTTYLKFNEKSKRSWNSEKKGQGEDRWKKLEESRQQQFKMLQRGLMSRENAQKMIANEAMRTGTTACILRS
ncbi:cilia- and flagella-associated protein 99 isoform 10-T12 [Liasis olivaceus]